MRNQEKIASSCLFHLWLVLADREERGDFIWLTLLAAVPTTPHLVAQLACQALLLYSKECLDYSRLPEQGEGRERSLPPTPSISSSTGSSPISGEMKQCTKTNTRDAHKHGTQIVAIFSYLSLPFGNQRHTASKMAVYLVVTANTQLHLKGLTMHYVEACVINSWRLLLKEKSHFRKANFEKRNIYVCM